MVKSELRPNALEVESMLCKGGRQKINVFQLVECFLGLSGRVDMDMQEALC
jgi:hypothetical protein